MTAARHGGNGKMTMESNLLFWLSVNYLVKVMLEPSGGGIRIITIVGLLVIRKG